MPWVGFKPTVPASERVKAVHALDRSVTVTGDGVIVFQNTILIKIAFSKLKGEKMITSIHNHLNSRSQRPKPKG
jgi:hypothetical protein